MLTFPLHCFLNDKNIFHINFTRSLTFQWKLVIYGETRRAFWKQNFGLCSTTYYLTVPITCTQTRIHRTQSLHYDKLLKRRPLWQNVYLRGLIERQPVKKHGNHGCDSRAEDGKGNAKNCTYQYYVQTPALQCVQVRLVIASCIIFPRFRKHLFYHNFY